MNSKNKQRKQTEKTDGVAPCSCWPDSKRTCFVFFFKIKQNNKKSSPAPLKVNNP
jgi:hypothetical protein